MEEREYILNGTIEDLDYALKREFKLTEEEINFFRYVLISEKESRSKYESSMELWHVLNQDKYNSTIFNTRYSISLTDFKISFLKKLYLVVGTFLLDQSKIGISFVLDAILSLYESCYHVKDDECCVYFLALKYKSEHKHQDFSEDELFKYVNPTVCSFLGEDWSCRFLKGETCTVNKSMITQTLDALCEKKVMKKNNGYYDFTI